MKQINFTVIARIHLPIDVTEYDLQKIKENDKETISTLKEMAKDLFDYHLSCSPPDYEIFDCDLPILS